MREILFRGKRVDNGMWVFGFYIENELFGGGLEPSIIPVDEKGAALYDDDGYNIEIKVNPETVGQYTGLKDKNGLTKIFEYDIIDANGRKVGNYYENSDLLKDGTCFLVARMGTKEWSRSEQEAIKRGCKYAE